MVPNGAECCRMVPNVAIWCRESVSNKFNENQNLVEDILGAAVASITKAHVQEKLLVKFYDVQGSNSEKRSPQSQNRVPARVEVTSSEEVVILFQLVFISIM